MTEERWFSLFFIKFANWNEQTKYYDNNHTKKIDR